MRFGSLRPPELSFSPDRARNLFKTYLVTGTRFLNIFFIRMSLFASVQFHLVKVFMSFPIALPKRWCNLRGSCFSLFSVLTKERGWVDLPVRNCYSSLLFQVLGYTPDFVSTAMAPYINDIHRKGIA